MGIFSQRKCTAISLEKRMALSDFVFLKIFQLSPEPITNRKGDLGRLGVGVRFYISYDFTSCCLDGHHLLLYS